MSKKALVILDQDHEMRVINEDLEKGMELLNESISFMKKQAKANYEKLVKVHWTRFEDALRERNLLPADYSKEKYDLEISNGVLYLKDNNDKNDFRSFLTNLFGDR